jgi:hypothetical protein
MYMLVVRQILIQENQAIRVIVKILNVLKHRNKLYIITIDKNGGWENWEMIELETHPCANKKKH